MKHLLKYTVAIAVFAALFFFAGEVAAQCPMCKAAVETGMQDGSSPMADGLNTGILYLFVLPYLMVGLIGFIVFRAYRNKKKAQAEAQS